MMPRTSWYAGLVRNRLRQLDLSSGLTEEGDES